MEQRPHVEVNDNWWKLKSDDPDLPGALSSVITKLDEDQDYRQEQNLRNLRLYSNLAIMGLGAAEYTGSEALPTNRLTLNVVESCVETVKALIGTNRPKIRFLTEGGKRKDLKLAENLTRFLSGQFYGTKAYELGAEAISDGTIFGTGALKIYEDDDTGDVAVERVFPDELIVDDMEAKYGRPRTLYQTKDIERTVLLAKYPELAEYIAGAGHFRDEVPISTGYADPVTVVMAWHLPSYPGAGDGRYIESLDTVTLMDEEWTEDDFPFAFFRWIKRPLGFWGKGVPEQLRGVQIEINMLLQKVQRLMALASSKVFVHKGSQVNTKALDNTEWGVVSYVGDKPPVFHTVQAVAPEYYAQLESLYRRAFEIVGISQMTAQATKPEGLDSGRAVREFNAIQTQRHRHIGQMVEQFYLDVADKMIACAKRIPNYEVLADDDERVFRIKWKDVNPGKQRFKMKAYPASLLPDTPAGQLQAITELIQIEPRMQRDALKWLKQPDVNAAIKRANAPQELMEKIIEAILEDGRYIPPKSHMDLQEGITTMQYAALEAEADGVEEGKLALMRKWMEEAHNLLLSGQQALQPPVALPGAGSPGANIQPQSPELELPGMQSNVPVGATG